MRFSVLAVLAAFAFIAAMSFEATDANAVVYCKTVGVPKGCVERPKKNNYVSNQARYNCKMNGNCAR